MSSAVGALEYCKTCGSHNVSYIALAFSAGANRQCNACKARGVRTRWYRDICWKCRSVVDTSEAQLHRCGHCHWFHCPSCLNCSPDHSKQEGYYPPFLLYEEDEEDEYDNLVADAFGGDYGAAENWFDRD